MKFLPISLSSTSISTLLALSLLLILLTLLPTPTTSHKHHKVKVHAIEDAHDTDYTLWELNASTSSSNPRSINGFLPPQQQALELLASHSRITYRTELVDEKLIIPSDNEKTPDTIVESTDDDDNSSVPTEEITDDSAIMSSKLPPMPHGEKTRHLLMIDAGSGGSRLHVYEFHERKFNVIPPGLSDVTTDSRWTSRLSPGISTFSEIDDDDELIEAMGIYLCPLIDFAKLVLSEKEGLWSDTRIYLKATGGMRVLSRYDRERILHAIRRLFRNDIPVKFLSPKPKQLKRLGPSSNSSKLDKKLEKVVPHTGEQASKLQWFSPFQFLSDNQARIISGEEEAIYGWACINYLMGTLYENSVGFGTVSSPNKTYGALDLGGASTQISFYDFEEDVVANLFKLQLGASKHWNVYAHSFLYYGVNLARERLGAKLADGKTVKQAEAGLYDPCLPGGFNITFHSKIHINENGIETWGAFSRVGKDAESYEALFLGGNQGGEFDLCLASTKTLLRLESNQWCDFAHGGECSFAGIYQPPLPEQSVNFGEFFGFANYLHIWKFAYMPMKSTVKTLRDRAHEICSMSSSDLVVYNQDREQNVPFLHTYCFLTTYAFAMLHYGYGFDLDVNITVANVINGQKVGWVMGSVLYEINTLDWTYANDETNQYIGLGISGFSVFLGVCCVVLSWELVKERKGKGGGSSIWEGGWSRSKTGYTTIKEQDPV